MRFNHGGEFPLARSMTKTRSNPIARREIMRRAAKELERLAKTSAFVPSYARMNPAADLVANVFFFGEHGRAPRIVIFGPWAYVDAADLGVFEGVENLSEEFRAKKHLGALHARIFLGSSEALATLQRVARVLQRGDCGTTG